MLGHLRALLEGIAAGPERGVCELPLLGDEERRLLARLERAGRLLPAARLPARALRGAGRPHARRDRRDLRGRAASPTASSTSGRTAWRTRSLRAASARRSSWACAWSARSSSSSRSSASSRRAAPTCRSTRRTRADRLAFMIEDAQARGRRRQEPPPISSRRRQAWTSCSSHADLAGEPSTRAPRARDARRTSPT